MESDEVSNTVDVLRYGKEGGPSKYVTVPSDAGMKVVGAHRDEESRRRLVRTAFTGVGALIGAAVGTFFSGIGVGLFVAAIIVVVGGVKEYLRGYPVPELVATAIRRETAEEEYDIHTHVENPFDGDAVDEEV